MCFFLASEIRVRKGKLDAWDSSLALFMLVNKYISVIPNESCITNVGSDQFASHTKLVTDTELIASPSERIPSTKIDVSLTSMQEIDKRIEKNIYNMKLKQLFSPLKATLEK